MADDDVSLPRATLQKWIKDATPADLRVSGEASDLILKCCNEFVQVVPC
jgi:histone H3/H4